MAAWFIIETHTGSTVSLLNAPAKIISGWSKPAQTAQVTFEVNPTNQLSVKPYSVPLLPATG